MRSSCANRRVDSASSTATNCSSHVKGECAFCIRNLGAGNRCLIARSLQAMLSFVAALEQISNAEIELLDSSSDCPVEKSDGEKIGRNWESKFSVGLGRRFAVISCAWFCRMRVRVAFSE